MHNFPLRAKSKDLNRKPFTMLIPLQHLSQRHIGKYLKTCISKIIVDVIKLANFQLYRKHPSGDIWKN